MKKDETIGGRLRKARLKSGLTLEEVYKNLKIHPKILEDLEDNRIDPRIGEIYVKAFLKKYANFLGFETDKILSEFTTKRLQAKEPKREIFINIGREKKSPHSIIKNRFKRSLLPLIAIFGLLFTVSIISYAGFRLITEFKRLRPTFSDALTKKDKPKADAPKDDSLVIPKNEPLVLKVETKDKVWLRVKSDGKVIFEHTLPKGSIENWHAKDKLELRLGRPEAVVLTLNDKRLSLPDRSRIKNIIIDHKGLRVEKR